MPEDLSSTCAAPAVITPGSVHPGMGNGRSSAPVARMTARAATERTSRAAGGPCDTPISQRPSSRRCAAHTVAAQTQVAPDWRKASIIAAPRA